MASEYTLTLSVADVIAEREAARPVTGRRSKARTEPAPVEVPDIYDVRAEALTRLAALMDADGITYDPAELAADWISEDGRVEAVRAYASPLPGTPANFIGGPLDGTSEPCPYVSGVYRRPDGVSYIFRETTWTAEGAAHVFDFNDPAAAAFTWSRA